MELGETTGVSLKERKDFVDTPIRQFANRRGGVWTKVKFYQKMPENSDHEIVEEVRFREAIAKARVFPIMLKREDVSCAGARHNIFSRDHRRKGKSSMHVPRGRDRSSERALNLCSLCHRDQH